LKTMRGKRGPHPTHSNRRPGTREKMRRGEKGPEMTLAITGNQEKKQESALGYQNVHAFQRGTVNDISACKRKKTKGGSVGGVGVLGRRGGIGRPAKKKKRTQQKTIKQRQQGSQRRQPIWRVPLYTGARGGSPHWG